MFYTIFTLIVWLLDGAPDIKVGFFPIFMAFVIAIVVDLFFHYGPWTKKQVVA